MRSESPTRRSIVARLGLRAHPAMILALALIGCGARPVTPASYALGTFDASDHAALFGRVSDALVELGYPVAQSDQEHGWIEVSSHRRSRREGVTFRAQLHDDGWIVLTPSGAGVVQTDLDAWSMHPAMAEEYAALAVHLRETLERGGEP